MANYDKKTGTAGTVRMQITYTQNAANNTTTFSVKFQVICTQSATYSYGVSWNGNTAGTSRSGKFDIDGAETVTVGTWTITKTHGSDGKLSAQSFSFTMGDTGTSGLAGPTTVSTSITPPRIPKVPGKPPKPVFQSASTTSITYTFSAPSDNGGSSITNYNHQSATDSGFTQNVKNWNDSSSPATANDLIPGTGHYVRTRAVNSVGAGPWSDALSQTTLPAVAPGLTVVADPPGTSATLSFTPPGGVTGVTKYRWRRRLQGETTETSGDSTTTTAVVGGLTPGAVYEWRATAFIGTYESPTTDWMAIQQPNPNVDPGDYFDGDTADKPDIEYSWGGDPHGSISIATGKAVIGWSAFDNGTSMAVALHQTTGGAALPDGSIAGDHAARVPFLADTLTPTFEAGPNRTEPGWADIAPVTPYYGSIYVYPSRPQFMAAALIWSDADGAGAGRAVGVPQLLPANTWTRLTVNAASPDDAAFATVRATDVDGPEWTPWHSGDSITLDAAMISLGAHEYFDGDTADSGSWVYSWEGEANASVSSATATVDSELDPLEDPDCPKPPRPPRPPVIVEDCIVEVGTWNRYWLIIPESVVTEWLTMVPSILLKIGAEPARQVRIRIYPNPDNLAPEEFAGEWSSEQIVSYLPPFSNMLIDGVDQRSWASVNGGPRLRADHRLYGTGGTPATWPLLTCGISYLASFDVPLDASSGNLEVEIALTQRRSA